MDVVAADLEFTSPPVQASILALEPRAPNEEQMAVLLEGIRHSRLQSK